MLFLGQGKALGRKQVKAGRYMRIIRKLSGFDGNPRKTHW